MRKLFTLLSIILYVTTYAQSISVEKAKDKARMLFSSKTSNKSSGISALSQPVLAYSATLEGTNDAAFYVFNNPDGGFAIIGGDESAKEIIGYSLTGYFDTNNLPEGLCDMLQIYKEQIVAGIASTAPRSTRIMEARKNIEDLIKTKWGQSEPFNNSIPTLGTGYPKFVTGCNATAAAQIMKYWEYAVGNGSHSYTINYNGSMPVTFYADFSNTTYDFANMLLKYNGAYTKEESEAVSTLLYHAGVAMNMSYNSSKSGGSSSYTTAPGRALATNFGYSKQIRSEHRDFYSDEDWEELIYNELKEGRPVLYGGDDAKVGGHAFIIHGYKDGMYAVNWGWNGSCDGYFTLSGSDALNSVYEGQFNQSQTATINIQPDKDGTSTYSVSINNYGDFIMSTSRNSGTVSEITVDKQEGDATAFLHAQFYNSGLFDADFEYGVAFRNKETGETFLTGKLGSESLRYSTSMSTKAIMFKTDCILRNGTYDVMLVYRPQGSVSAKDWQMLRVSTDNVLPTITMTNAGGDGPLNIHFGITNTSINIGETADIIVPGGYDGVLTFTSSDTSIATVDENGVITGVGLGKATITVHSSATELFNEGDATFDITVTDSYKGLVFTELAGSNYSKKIQISNEGSGVITIKEIKIRDKSNYNKTASVAYNTSLSPNYYTTVTINIPYSMPNPAYEVVYEYNGKTFSFFSDPDDPNNPDHSTGIHSPIWNSTSTDNMIFDISGKRINTLKKGINIIRMPDGSVRKIMKR